MPFHHDPAHNDNMLDAFFDDHATEPFTMLPAREGTTLDLAELADA